MLHLIAQAGSEAGSTDLSPPRRSLLLPELGKPCNARSRTGFHDRPQVLNEIL